MNSPTVTIIQVSPEELARLIREHSRPAAVPPLLYTLEQAAEALGIGVTTLKGMIKAGELQVIKRGASTRIAVADLHAWIERQREVAPGSYTDPSHDGR